MEIDITARAKISSDDLKGFVEEVMKTRGYKVVSGLENSALTGIQLRLELTKLTPDEKEVARREKIRQASLSRNGGGGGGLKQKKVVAIPDDRPL